MLGQARVILPGDVEFAEISVPVSRVSEEIEALEQAVKQTIEEINELLDSAGKKIGGPVARIFDAQLLIADDEQFLKQVKHEIRSKAFPSEAAILKDGNAVGYQCLGGNILYRSPPIPFSSGGFFASSIHSVKCPLGG